MVNFIRNFFQKKADNYAVGSGNQQTVDPQLLYNYQGKIFYRSLRPSERLHLYHAIHSSNPIGHGAVEVLTKMVNSTMVPESGDPETDEQMREVWNDINGHEVNAMLIRSSLIYGYAVGEIVWNNRTLDLERIVVPESHTIRFVSNNFGEIESIRQLIKPTAEPTIPASKMIICRNNPTDSFDLYGCSLFSAAVDQFEALCQILDAQLKVYMRLGKPRYQVNIPSEGLMDEEFRDRIAKTKSVFDQLATGTDLYMPEGVEINIIGAESFGQKFEAETRLLISTILSSIGLPPALMHVNIQSAGTESYARQSILCLQTMLSTLQESLAKSWNQSFWPLVQQLYGMKTAPKMCFDKPRLLEQQQKEAARQAYEQNDWNEVLKGRSLEWYILRRDASLDEYDITVLQQAIEQARIQPQSESNTNPNTNKKSTTKLTDESLSNDSSY